jgi:hypothetical protein
MPPGSSSVRHRGGYPQLDYRIGAKPDEVSGRLIPPCGANEKRFLPQNFLVANKAPARGGKLRAPRQESAIRTRVRSHCAGPCVVKPAATRRASDRDAHGIVKPTPTPSRRTKQLVAGEIDALWQGASAPSASLREVADQDDAQARCAIMPRPASSSRLLER